VALDRLATHPLSFVVVHTAWNVNAAALVPAFRTTNTSVALSDLPRATKALSGETVTAPVAKPRPMFGRTEEGTRLTEGAPAIRSGGDHFVHGRATPRGSRAPEASWTHAPKANSAPMSVAARSILSMNRFVGPEAMDAGRSVTVRRQDVGTYSAER
jgi:hypothetical protein